MEYQILPNSEQIRHLFVENFVESYESFSSQNKELIAQLRTDFTKEYYDKMFMWDKTIKIANEISFSDALALLKSKACEVFFLTESPQCPIQEFCRLNKQKEFVAAANANDLADCISYEWFTEYDLFEQGRYLADPILPAELYVFDASYSWCLIFTHETDETETAESRFCLSIDKNGLK